MVLFQLLKISSEQFFIPLRKKPVTFPQIPKPFIKLTLFLRWFSIIFPYQAEGLAFEYLFLLQVNAATVKFQYFVVSQKWVFDTHSWTSTQWLCRDTQWARNYIFTVPSWDLGLWL